MTLDTYRSIGLIIAISGLILSALTYILLGIIPLLALWIGLIIIGISMYLTPSKAPLAKETVILLENMFSNIARVIETFSIGTSSIYVKHGDEVYAYISRHENLPRITDNPPKAMIITGDGEPILVLKSPISKPVIEGYEEACSAIDYVTTELLNIADSIKCVEEDEVVIVEVKNPYLSTPSSIEKTLGSIYAIISASITTLIRGTKSVVEKDVKVGNRRRIIVRKLGER